jgi:PAS domain S-box-containing protein
MKSGKTKTKRRRAVPENGSARAPVSKTAKTKPKKRLDERPSRTTLKSRRVIEERLAAILATIDDVVWSIAAYTYETLYLNPAAERIYGRTASAFYADPQLFMNIVHSEDRPRVAQLLPELIEKGTLTIQYRVVRPDGEVRWLEDHTAIARDADGRPVRFNGVASDITERKAHEAQLQAKQSRIEGCPASSRCHGGGAMGSSLAPALAREELGR